MDAQARKKAAYRAKLKASSKPHKQLRDSPLLRYNEHDQPVCRVCEVVLKSDSLWPAHQASRKHHEAIKNLKANAAAKSQVSNVKPQSPKIPEYKSVVSEKLYSSKPESSNPSLKSQTSSGLPSDFFDNQESKRQIKDLGSTKLGNSDSNRDFSTFTQAYMEEPLEIKMDGLIKEQDIKNSASLPSKTPRETASSEANQVKKTLPEGFFDNKDADLRARGITLVKPDVKDELKEFEKLIQEDLKEVDNRLEEEEIDAAETIEEAESVEQRTYRERVEMLKRKKSELQAAKMVSGKGVDVKAKKSVEESSSDDDSDDDFAVDWRAKHL